MIREIDAIQEKLKEYFKQQPHIELVYIFGSLVQGKANVLSDIDIAILLDKKEFKDKLYPYGYKAEILADLMKLLKTNNVDLVILNDASPLLKHRVLYFGRIIYSKDEGKRIQFQIEAIDKYNDLRYLLKPHLGTGGKR